TSPGHENRSAPCTRNHPHRQAPEGGIPISATQGSRSRADSDPNRQRVYRSAVARPPGSAYTLMRLARREHTTHVRDRLSEAGVESSFFICTAPRTGSNPLARLPARAGEGGWAAEPLGNPARPGPAPPLPPPLREYLA